MWTNLSRALLLLPCMISLAGNSAYAQAPATTRNTYDPDRPPFDATPVTGPYYALIIGNNDYEYAKQLVTPVKDALSLASLLHYNYGFTTRILIDATRHDILNALSDYRHTLPPESNLLIYYAGHGARDRDAGEAYWWPVDAKANDNSNWISADDITSNIKAMPSQHVIVISDSCYSGALADFGGVRAARPSMDPVQTDRFFARVLRDRSRTLLASGGDEPVDDLGGSGHSIFAQALLDGLSEEKDSRFTAGELYGRAVDRRVTGQSEIGQKPLYSPLARSGDQDGDFVFSKRRAEPLFFNYCWIFLQWVTRTPPGWIVEKAEEVQKGAEKGDSGAMAVVASLYRQGKYFKQDYAQAVLWSKKAADLGNAESMTELGFAYSNGLGVPQNKAEAYRWFQRAADAGDVVAMNIVATLYARGEGGKKDDAKAAFWYRKSADMGFGVSMADLGSLYLQGKGVPRDYSEAARWLRRSLYLISQPASLGSTDVYGPEYDQFKDYVRSLGRDLAGDKQRTAIEAFKGLASIYEGGLGVERDRSVALAWYRKAAALGDREAAAAVKRLQ